MALVSKYSAKSNGKCPLSQRLMRVNIDAHTYDLVVGSVCLKPATPLAAQGVTSGCSISLKPATREFV